jgi:hypothetical protein
LLLPVGFVAFVMAYRFFIRETEEIQILDDGIVVFSKVVLETRVAALDITGVYRAKRWLNQEDEPRAVRIEHKLGNVRLARFNEIEEFIEDLRRLNPLVEVEQGL